MSEFKHQLVISGSSITEDSAWPTWATFIQKKYGIKDVSNISVKGIGNEVIILRAIEQAKLHNNPTVVVQLTNVDKWDWYVENQTIFEELINEKHPILPYSNAGGYWSTGSHFPKWKEYYYENYYSITHQMFKTLQLMVMFQHVCKANSWNSLILFDSPVLTTTEQDLNTGSIVHKDLTNNRLCKVLEDQIDFADIYKPGLIGYADSKGLPWYSKRFKGHPGSAVHLEFANDIVSPWLEKTLGVCDRGIDLTQEANKLQRLFVDV